MLMILQAAGIRTVYLTSTIESIYGIYYSHNFCKVITFTNVIMLMVDVKCGVYSMTSSGMAFICISTEISSLLEMLCFVDRAY
jgi:hypothetical protein